MDRLSQLRGEAGGSGDSTLDTTSLPSEAFMSANENSSKYFSINDSTFDITPIKDESLASTSAEANRSIADGDEVMPNLSPIAKKDLNSYKIGEQIEAANILSGGVDIFEGDDTSFDGDELVIDDNIEAEDKIAGAEVAPVEVEEPAEIELEPEPELEPELELEPIPVLVDVANREMDIQIEIEGNIVNAIFIGNGLYLYRKEGQDELAAVQITSDDPEHKFKFLKVRDNADGNLEVYEEIEIEVPSEMPAKKAKLLNRNTPNVPTSSYSASASGSSRTSSSNSASASGISTSTSGNSASTSGNSASTSGNSAPTSGNSASTSGNSASTSGNSASTSGNSASTSVTSASTSSNSASTSTKVDGKYKSIQVEPVASTSTGWKNSDKKETSPVSKTEVNVNGKMIKLSESRKSPVVSSFSAMTYHSTPNKEGKPLTKTMVDLQLDPNRYLDNVKNTIDVHTENIKQKPTELATEKGTLIKGKSADITDTFTENKVSTEIYKKVTTKQEVNRDKSKTKSDATTGKKGSTDIINKVTDKQEVKPGNSKEKNVQNQLQTKEDTVTKEKVTTEISNKEVNKDNSKKENVQNQSKADNSAGEKASKEISNKVASKNDVEKEIFKEDVQNQSEADIVSDQNVSIELSITQGVKKDYSKKDVQNQTKADTSTGEKVSTETSYKVINKQDMKKDNSKKEDVQNLTEAANLREVTGKTLKAEIDTEKNSSKQHTIEGQNKNLTTSNSNRVSNTRERSVNKDGAVSQKEVSITKNNDIHMVFSQPSTSKAENKAVIVACVNSEKLDINSQVLLPVVEQLKPVDMDSGVTIPAMNIVENSSETKTDLTESTVKAAIPVVKKAQNTTHETKEVKSKPKIKILKNISVSFPTTSVSSDKSFAVKNQYESCMKPNNDNVIQFPLESFSEVSSTCTNLGSEESKEESITLYAIDTDESVSLITPSSTTKRDDKVVLTDKTSEVFTTIANLSDIQTENSPVNNEKPILSLPTVKECTVQTKAKKQADSKITEQASCSKFLKAEFAEIINSQKSTKEIKEHTTVLDTKLPEKATSSTPVLKIKDSESFLVCTLEPKKKPAIVETPIMIEVKPTIKGSQPSLAHATRISEKEALSDVKPLVKLPNVPGKHANAIEKPLKPAVSQITVQPAAKPEPKPREKEVVPASALDVYIAEKKFSAPIAKHPPKVTNTTYIPAEVKRPEVTPTTSSKTVKSDSHIPVVSVANKPSSKSIPVIALKVAAITKSLDHTASQIEIAKNNTMEKNAMTTKTVTRDVKDPIRKSIVTLKPVNNYHTAAVPFGKWTDANRQEFLNKFKEAKVPLNTNSKQIKNSNDLNRRDVLLKIDSQRAQTNSNATAKGQEKISVKSETMFSNKVVSPAIETKSELADITLKEASDEIISKQENASKGIVTSILPTSNAKDTKAKTVDKLKSGPSSLPTVGKIEPAPKKQSAVDKTEPAPREQTTVSETEPPRDQSTISKIEPVSREHTTVCKTESAPKDKNTASCYMASLIDKTIEDMISRVAPGKTVDEPKPATSNNTSELDSDAQKSASTQEVSKPPIDDAISLDDIEMKMNELHGIPFVERPPHELPKIPKPEMKTYSKIDKNKLSNIVSNTNCTSTEPPNHVKDLDSDEEIIEHEPVTGDLDLKAVKVKIASVEKKNMSEKSKSAADEHASNKDAEIITETEFDKFARRNSITYENCLTVNFDQNVIQTIKEKDIAPKGNPKPEPTCNEIKSKMPIQTVKQNIQADKSQSATKHGSVAGDSSNKKYQSKIHSAYQSALTAKHQVSRPISIIEDKPVKVVFLESSIGFVPGQLNVQGQELSPSKKSEAETFMPINNDSLDSGVSEVTNEKKPQDKIKTKHQRKQVLTPVPDLELIQPSDIGIETTSKKKKKMEEVTAKNLVPKKSYLLGRSTTTDEKSQKVSIKDNTKNVINQSADVPEHKDTVSAIDNLVKAAELLENQAENKSVTSSPGSHTNTPLKRGRGRPRKYPLPDGVVNDKSPSPEKKPRLIDAKPMKQDSILDYQDDYSSNEEGIIRENWTMGKINENIVCPICNKLFRSENVVFKHVKHCTGVSPNRSESDNKSPSRSRLSQESEGIDMDYDMSSNESKKDIPKKRKSKESTNYEANPDDIKLNVVKDDVIVIEDTPIKKKFEKLGNEKEEDSKKESKVKVSHQNKSLVCEFCGKTFRQLSYLTSHKLQHKKDLAKKKEKDTQDSGKLQVFSCEVCKKEFRKLHHLVQHRINHNPDAVPKRALRKSLSEQYNTKNVNEDVVKQVEDTSTGFRCEPCDKSFRKLHHLVEHRGTHDVINQKKPSVAPQPTVEKPPPPPQCEICKKTFRKLHHLIEHKEQHADTSSDKSDDKSIKSALSTKDIIHECALCYMVFPNEHSLNKHSVNCSKKKRQSKQLKDTAEHDSGKDEENSNSEKIKDDKESADVGLPDRIIIDDDNVAKEHDSEELMKSTEVKITAEVVNTVVTDVKQNEKEISTEEATAKPLLEEEAKSIELLSTPAKRDLVKLDSNKETERPLIPQKIRKIDLNEMKTQDIPKKKTVLKGKSTPNVTKREKSMEAQLPAVNTIIPSVESSDDDEIRYMLNPNFKVDETSEGKIFMKVRTRKRNSLQIERPNSNNLDKRRISLQLPPKVSRLKLKAVETKSKAVERKPFKVHETKSKLTDGKTLSVLPMKLKQAPKLSKAEAVLSIDSDDSDVKYSFPKTAPETPKPAVERTPKVAAKKIPRKSLVEKRKSLGGIAKRKSSGTVITAKRIDNPAPAKPFKKRSLGVEHRCDCGELFSSAALLSRHTSLAHTPPRIRRRRDPPAPAPAPAPAPVSLNKHKPTRLSSSKSDATPTATKPTRKSNVKKAEPTTPVDSRSSLKPAHSEAKSAPRTRRPAAHTGVPVPEKMRKIMQKNMK